MMPSVKTGLRSSTLGALAVLVMMWVLAPESPVAVAAKRGDTDAVRTLLKQGEDVNAAEGDGMTALHWAAYNGDAGLASMLIYAGASLEARTRVGEYTPLLVAAKAGSGEIIPLLLEAGSDATAATSTGVSALHFAAATGSVEGVEALIAAGAEVDGRDGAQGQTPLMFAAANGRTEAVMALLAHGAQPELTTVVVDIPALEKADREDERARQERLRAEIEAQRQAEALARGEVLEDEVEPEAEEAPVDEPETPDEEPPVVVEPAQGEDAPIEPGFSGAADEPRADAEGEPGDDDESNEERQQIQPFTNGDLIGGHGGMTALLHAARMGHADAALALLEAGSDINQVSEGDHTSPLLIATLNGHFDLGLEFLAAGADPNLASDAGTTPLYAAINLQWAPRSLYPQPKDHLRQQVGYLDYMRALLDAGADPNARLEKHLWYMSYNFDLLGVDTGGATPFWRAAYGLDIPAMKLLLEYDADPTIPTKKAPQRRRRGQGDVEDPSGLPPVEIGGPAIYPIHAASGVGFGKGYAANSHRGVPDGWVPAVRFLVEELGADVNARDHDGFAPLHHAASRGDVELILYLVEMGADVTLVSRRGQTTADMANGPVQRVEPWPEAMALLEELGSVNNHNCVSC